MISGRPHELFLFILVLLFHLPKYILLLLLLVRGVWGGFLLYLVSACVQLWSVANNWTATCHLSYPETVPDAVWPLGKSADASIFLPQFSGWLNKAGRTSSHLLADHNEERPIIPQPQCERCHRAGTGQATLEVNGNKWHSTLKCCTLNNVDDDVISTTALYSQCAGRFALLPLWSLIQ